MQIQSTNNQPVTSSRKSSSKNKIQSQSKSTLKIPPAPKDLSSLSKEPKLSGANSQLLNGFNQNFGSKALPAIPDPSNKGIGLQPDPKAAFGTPYVPKKNSGIGLEPPPTSSIGVPYQPKSGAEGTGGQSPINGPIPLPGGPVEPMPPVPGFPSGGGGPIPLPGGPVEPMPPVPGFPSGGGGPIPLPGGPVEPLPKGQPWL